jgi:hypothetical protein
MKNKVESLQGYHAIEANDDVIKLLNGLKELTFKMHEVQYGYWTICQTVRRVLTMRQQDNERLGEYYKRFTSCADVAESQWGTLVPTAAATNERNEKTSRDKFITCVFLAGVDTKYGRLKTELNNTYVAEQNNYPKTVESGVTMLSHYMNDKGVYVADEDKGQATLTSFMQKHKNAVTCYKCGKKGHYANKSPDGDNDDEASIRSSLSNRSNRSNDRVGWSG